jgi:hypothetical protein
VIRLQRGSGEFWPTRAQLAPEKDVLNLVSLQKGLDGLLVELRRVPTERLRTHIGKSLDAVLLKKLQEAIQRVI